MNKTKTKRNEPKRSSDSMSLEAILKSSTLNSVSLSLAKNFRVFLDGISDLYDLTLPFPTLDYSCDKSFSKSLKSFCDSAFDKDHLYNLICRRKSRDCFYSVAHSLFQFRKVIPSERPSLDDYREKLVTPSKFDPEFVKFAIREVRRIFPRGWDSGYQDACCSTSIPFKSCLSNSRKNGGSRVDFLNESTTHFDYINVTTSLKESLGRIRSKISCVPSGGKFRLVSVPESKIHYLRPLHHVFYNFLSRKDFILRGEARASSFKDFVPVEGEVFVSGDYESATDNLNQETQRIILAEVLSRTSHVPRGIIDFALESLSVDFKLEGDDTWYRQLRGQMMGNLLSFPLLCLVNYLSFRFSIPRDVPVKINGDDIVFRCRPDEAETWFRNVSASGLVVSKGKTLVDKRFFSLNSRIFRAVPSGGRACPFLRPKAIFNLDISSLGGCFKTCCSGMSGAMKKKAQGLFLRVNKGQIYRSRLSLIRGHSMRLSVRLLEENGLKDRERFYLSLPSEVPIPTEKAYFSDRPCDRYERFNVVSPSKRQKALCHSISQDLVSRSFSGDLVHHSDDDFINFRSPYIVPNRNKARRLLGLTVSSFRKYTKVEDSFFHSFYPSSQGTQLLRERLAFRTIKFQLGETFNADKNQS